MNRYVSILGLLVACPSLAVADGPVCSDQLHVEKMRAYRLDEHRDKLEQEKATLEYALYQEQQKRKAVEANLVKIQQELAEAKKPKEEKKAE